MHTGPDDTSRQGLFLACVTGLDPLTSLHTMPLDIAALRQQFRAAKSELLTQFQHSRPTSSSASLFLKRMAQLVDDTPTTLWQAHALPPDAALVAVGGYGRAELFPHSAVAVLLLLPLTPQPGGHHTPPRQHKGSVLRLLAPPCFSKP